MSQMSATAEVDNWDSHWGLLSEVMQINPAVDYRWRIVRKLLAIEGDGAGSRFLDIGCGDGSFVSDLARRYPKIKAAGVDGSQVGVSNAAARNPGGVFHQVDLMDADAPGCPELDHWATHALCSEVMEHVDDPSALLRNSKRYLAPGARLIITVPSGPMSSLDKFVGHRKHYTPGILAQEVAAAGLTVERIWRTGFPFHNLYRLLVVMRGQTIVEESTQPVASLPFLTRTAMDLFRRLFYFNLNATPFGWQIIAAVRMPT